VTASVCSVSISWRWRL